MEAQGEHMIPPVGTRYHTGESATKGIWEYAGRNPAPEFEWQDACLIRACTSVFGGHQKGDVLAVEPRWFTTHRRAA